MVIARYYYGGKQECIPPAYSAMAVIAVIAVIAGCDSCDSCDSLLSALELFSSKATARRVMLKIFIIMMLNRIALA